MNASGKAVGPSREPERIPTTPGDLRIYQHTLKFQTSDRLELVNITGRINELVEKSGIRRGFVNVSTLHTTVCLFINEWQDALLHDIRQVLEQLIGRDGAWRHNDPQYSDCDRKNADSHLRAMLLGHTLSLQVERAELVLGQWQSIIMAELDGPRERDMSIQVIGIA